jgi:hypothetical protein
VNLVAARGRLALCRVAVATVFAIAGCAGALAGCGTSSTGKPISQAAILRKDVVRAVVGHPQNGPWQSTTVGRLRMAAIAVPRGDPHHASTVTAKVTATATITFASQGPESGQRLIPSSGATVTGDGSVTATVAEFGKKRVVQTALFNFAPPSERVRHDPAIHRLIGTALHALFTYRDDPAAYERAQLPFYGTSGNAAAAADGLTAETSAPALTTLPGAGGSLGGDLLSALFSSSCPSKSALLVLPATMTLSQLRISPTTKLVSSLPTVLEVDASVAVLGQGWTAVEPGRGTVMRCGPSTARIGLKLAVVKSMITGRWLIGEIQDRSGVCCASGFEQLYGGIDVLPT